MVILGHLITGTLVKGEDEISMELDGDYNGSIKDAIIELLPQIMEMFNGHYNLKVELIAEEVKTTTSTSSTS